MEAIQVLIPPPKETCPFQSEKDAWMVRDDDENLQIVLATIETTDKKFYDIAWLYRQENTTEFTAAFNDNPPPPVGDFNISLLEEGNYFCRKGILYQVYRSRNHGLSIMIATVFYSSELVELIAKYRDYSDLSFFLVKMYNIYDKEEVFSHISWCLIGTGPNGPVKFFYPAFSEDIPKTLSRAMNEYNWETMKVGQFFTNDKVLYQIKQQEGVLYFERSHLGIIKKQ